MLRKPFPLKAEVLLGKNSLTVWIDDSLWGGPVITYLSSESRNSEVRKITTENKPYAAFNDLPANTTYCLKVRFIKLVKRIRYESLKKEVYFNGQTRLRIQGVSSGRSGTKSLAAWLNGLTFNNGETAISRHETLASRILSLIIENKLDKVEDIVRSFSHNIELAPHFWLAPGSIIGEKTLFLVRDGRKVVTSGMKRGWYTRNSIWDKAKPDFEGDIFAKCCQFWAKSCEVLMRKADVVVRLEDLINSQETRDSLLKSLDMQHSENKPFPRLNVSKKTASIFEWTKEEHEVFKKYCGTWMDKFYPGWGRKIL